MEHRDRLPALRRALSHYLRVNAQACDTAAGIARWWMPAGLDVGESEMLPLLEEFRERGLLTRFSALGGQWLYRRFRVDAASDGELDRLTRDSNELH